VLRLVASHGNLLHRGLGPRRTVVRDDRTGPAPAPAACRECAGRAPRFFFNTHCGRAYDDLCR